MCRHAAQLWHVWHKTLEHPHVGQVHFWLRRRRPAAGRMGERLDHFRSRQVL